MKVMFCSHIGKSQLKGDHAFKSMIIFIVFNIVQVLSQQQQQQQQQKVSSNVSNDQNKSSTSFKPQQNLQSSNSCSVNYNFDELIFSIQWPLSFCYQKQDQCALDIARKKRWMIHGLWPNKSNQKNGSGGRSSKKRRSPNNNKNNNNNIEFCCGPQYDPKNINSKLYNQLIDKWPTLNSNGKHHTFWRHEWQKHGTCARNMKSLNNQNAYFQTILDLYQRYDLNKANFKNNKNYTLTELHQAIDPILGGKKPRIECSFVGSAGSNNRQSIFSEVRICFDKNLSPIDCKQGDDYQCKQPIYMP